MEGASRRRRELSESEVSVHGPNGTAVALSHSVYHSTADPPRAHGRHGTLRAHAGSTGTLGQCVALTVRVLLRQRDGCILLRPRWGAGRM
eukprot:1085402-Prymnesium_polylepis.1